MLEAIVSQNSFVLVLTGLSRNYRAICCKNGVSRRCALMKLSAKGGIALFLGGPMRGIAAIVSQYRAIWGHFKNSPVFPHSGGSLESVKFLESPDSGPFQKLFIQKIPFSNAKFPLLLSSEGLW